jgi:hypothetical protein
MGEEGRKKGEASRRKGGPVRGQGMTAAYYLAQTVVGLLFPFFFWFFFLGGGSLGLAMVFGKMGVQHSKFLNLAPTLGSVTSSIPHGAWIFYFFPNFIFAKIRVHLDLHIHS